MNCRYLKLYRNERYWFLHLQHLELQLVFNYKQIFKCNRTVPFEKKIFIFLNMNKIITKFIIKINLCTHKYHNNEKKFIFSVCTKLLSEVLLIFGKTKLTFQHIKGATLMRISDGNNYKNMILNRHMTRRLNQPDKWSVC